MEHFYGMNSKKFLPTFWSHRFSYNCMKLYIYVRDPFWVTFCIRCEIQVKIDFFIIAI